MSPKVESIDYSAFKAKIDSGAIHRVEIGEKYLTGFTLTKAQMAKYDSTRMNGGKPAEVPKSYQTVRIVDPDLVKLMDEKSIEYYGVVSEDNSWLTTLLSWVVPNHPDGGGLELLKQTNRQDRPGGDVIRDEQGEAGRGRRHGRDIQ